MSAPESEKPVEKPAAKPEAEEKKEEPEKDAKATDDFFKKALEAMQKRAAATPGKDETKQNIWHGIMGATQELKDPKVVAKSDQVARPGYSKTKATEFNEFSEDELKKKVKLLAGLIKTSKKLLVYTGAGISTNSGISDYATKATKTTTKMSIPAHKRNNPIFAEPSITHRILTHMHKHGFIKRWVQQNHDGLPQKAGYPQLELNEVHGSWYNPGNPVIMMDGTLRDDLIDDCAEWAENADLCLVLGTSLSGMNADRCATEPMERLTENQTGLGTCIINIQNTQYDEHSTVRIYWDVDVCMRLLAEELGIPKNDYEKPIPLPDLPKLYAKFGRWPKDHVYIIPYNSRGELDPTARMTLDLSDDAKIKIMRGRDTGTKGEVCGQRETHYKIRFWFKVQRSKRKKKKTDKGFPQVRTFGCWWIPLYIQGKVDKIDIMNVNPKVEFAMKNTKKVDASGATLKPSMIKKTSQ